MMVVAPLYGMNILRYSPAYATW